MACERLCINYGCIVSLLLLVQLLIVTIGTTSALLEDDHSYFHYGLSQRIDLEGDHEVSLLYHDELRRRRAVEATATTTPQVKPERTIISTNASTSVNVSYSTDNTTVPSILQANATAATAKPDQLKPKKVSVVISAPMNPSTGQPVMLGTIWANQTRWDNATQHPPEKVEISPPVNVTSPKDDDMVDDDISITKFRDVTNTTLSQNNITKTEEDTHQYYNSTFIINEAIGKKYWVDLDNHPDVKVNDLLSQSHRRAATVKLKFDFPFYGHKVRNITIATGGFLYTGEYVHSWLAATQYIAPLMANFDTRISIDSYVKYADNGTAFTVEWQKVYLQDKPEAGAFTFQATLHKNGDIVFVYSVIPLMVEEIEDTAHPVKVGLSDAYIMDRTVFFVRRKTIYEYHRVNFNRQDIQNWTVIVLRALPTCLQMDNCNECLTALTDFDCKWCPELQQCSTGTFRYRQDWLLKGCDVRNIRNESKCPAQPTVYKAHREEDDGLVRTDEGLTIAETPQQAKASPGNKPLDHSRENMNMSVSGVIGILIVVALIAGIAGWVVYAYRNPHSASGLMLIRYRPSQWSWRRGEARYTAATIHM